MSVECKCVDEEPYDVWLQSLIWELTDNNISIAVKQLDMFSLFKQSVA